MKKLFLSIVGCSLVFAASSQKNLKKIIPDENIIVVNQQYVDKLSKGWNLIGVEHNTNVDILKNVDIAWKYNNKTKKWEVYSPMPDIQGDLKNSSYSNSIFKNIPAGSGVWVYRKINLPIFNYLNYKIIDKNKNEVKVELIVNMSFPKDNNVFYEAKYYDNNVPINLNFLPAIDMTNLPTFDGDYAVADVNLTGGYHKITICEGVGSTNFSPATTRYNVCKSVIIDTGVKGATDFPDFGNIAMYDFFGKVTDDNDNPLSGVKVILPFPDRNITTVTDNEGNYDLKIDQNISFPVLVTASKDGYVPISKNVYKNDDLTKYEEDFKLVKKTDDVVILDKSLHHLGDDNYGGNINSQFQAKSEGVKYKKEFNLSDEFLNNYSQFTLTLYAKGLQYENPLYINGHLITQLDNSPQDGSFGKLSVSIPKEYLKNNNVIEIDSVQNNSSDYDDFEFANIQLKGE